MKCPYCCYPESKVVDSRPAEDGNSIRRRRECRGCHQRFTTYETVEDLPLMVLKRDGSKQEFNKGKLLESMIKACEKTVARETLQEIADEIDQTLQNGAHRQVSSATVGDMIVERLWDVDQVSCVRFASVYRQFRDVSSFSEEIDRLKEERKQKK